ncbi:hypothetical protein P7C71_g1454, partial [Lecanoromycetidae sp. Uapishka_2]
MPTKTEEDGSEDVNDFLLRIKELGDQRDKEDEERTRKLEEEIIQGRKERQARRAGGDTSSTGRVLAMSPAQGRISPERVDRPSSPTKGLGGFVQSAMMKRSDSVNKRWSAQAGPGLSRGNSIASNASAYTSSRYPVGGVTPLSESRPSSLSRDNSPALNSRPGSSHSNATVTQGHENDRPGTSTSTASNKSETNFESKFPKPTLGDEKSPPADEAMSPPASPSKRWSPAKASWLENAINKPDSPKFKSPAPQQPAWMADINRAKQQRGSVDLGKGNNFKEVSIGGLVRSPPLGAGYKVPGIGGLPSGFSAGVAAKPRKGSLEDINKRSGSPEPKKAEDLPSKVSSFTSQSITPSKPEIESVESAAATQHDEKAASASPAGKKVSQEELPSALAYTSKAKPETPPKKDFRTSLKPRPDSGELNSKDEPEFKNVFGKLKRTQTQNYKAPDELKENIMRGKSGLAQTGGPKKTERKDEFKESILQKKQGMVAPSASTRITSASSKTPNQSTPEAIAKRNGLTRSDSIILKSQPESPLKPRTMPVSGKTESDMTPAQREPDPEPQEIDGPLPSVKGAAALWGQSPKPTKLGGPRSPVKLPTRKDEEAAQEEAGLRRKECPDSELKASANGPSPLSDKPPSSPAAQSPKSPPLPGKKSASIANRVISATLHVPPSATMQSNTTVSSQPPQAAELLANIFDTPSSKQSINVDTQVVLDARSSNESSKKIKTLRKQIFEITDNGRSVPVPTQQEHILFEDSLYLCTHVFGTLAGQRTTEVYLWCGDGVSPSAVNDAQIFAKKATKDSNGKLIVLKQGKETTNFFQALGGIVITRRGSGRAESSATSYILCGRQHVGQIAFDEVDFHPQSLCHGFPYIVSTPGGKLYLWKGRGSGADELGCARLIGMDLGLTGDIEEVDDGKETNAFWQSLGGKPKSEEPRIQHWHLKPSCEKYTNRLLSIDVEMPRPKSSSGFMQWGRRGSAPSSDANAAVTAQIKEIVPFAQSDLVDDGVFVLDAFFEVFVILTVRTLTPAPQHKLPESSAFRAALLFAQEYSVLVASAEDRPFVPVSSVVICSRIGSGNGKEVESVPGGVKRAFRKWNDDCVKECRVLSLTAALEVTGA